MTAGRLNGYWTLIILFLIVIVIIGGMVAWLRYNPSQPIEISVSQSQERHGVICIGGAVANPGFYPFASKDSVESLIQAAGGTTSSADLDGLELYISEVGEEQEPQKVDINRADEWLLKALPGIGETLAERIVNYRRQNGAFVNTGEIAKVAGIGATTYEQIKHLITVSD